MGWVGEERARVGDGGARFDVGGADLGLVVPTFEGKAFVVVGGQRKRDEYLNDFFTYSVDTDEVEMITSAKGKNNINQYLNVGVS